jgi:hypothetical protein
MEDDDSIAASPMDWDAYEWSEEARGRKGSLLQGESCAFCGLVEGLGAPARARDKDTALR